MLFLPLSPKKGRGEQVQRCGYRWDEPSGREITGENASLAVTLQREAPVSPTDLATPHRA